MVQGHSAQGEGPHRHWCSDLWTSPIVEAIVEAITVGGITKEANTEEKGRCRHRPISHHTV